MPYLSVSRLALVLTLTLALAQPFAHAMDRDEAAARAQQASGGRVLAVDRAEQDGRPVFRVRVLTPSGEVRVIVVDARTGATR